MPPHRKPRSRRSRDGGRRRRCRARTSTPTPCPPRPRWPGDAHPGSPLPAPWRGMPHGRAAPRHRAQK
eukprot:scaffold41748_cov24-Phaeocystis_antarctica.AAC.1